VPNAGVAAQLAYSRQPRPAPARHRLVSAADGQPDSPWWVEQGVDGKKRIRTALHAGQWATMVSEARHTMMLAGTQGGKTSLGPLWLEREIRLCGPGDYMCITATFPLLVRKMLPEFLRYFQHTLKLGKWHASSKMFVFHDQQTRVMFGSANRPESLESATAKAAWLDECGQDQFRVEAKEAIDRRLSIYMGRALYTTTIYNRGWTKSEIYDKARNGDPNYRVVQFASIANPRFPREEYERVMEEARRTGQMWKVRMFYQGLYDQPPGLIYGCFKDSLRQFGGHLVSAATFQIPDWWPRYVGLDFGGSNTAKLYLAYDPVQEDYYAYKETLSGGLTARQHVEEIIRELNGAPLAGVWGGSRSESAWRMEFSAAGLIVQEPDMWDVEVGIDRGIGLFGTGHFFVLDDLVGFRDELGTYTRPVTPDGTVLPGIVDKNKFHRLDAFRALAMGLGSASEAIPVISIASARGWMPRAMR
jgi:hypothetical protein